MEAAQVQSAVCAGHGDSHLQSSMQQAEAEGSLSSRMDDFTVSSRSARVTK